MCGFEKESVAERDAAIEHNSAVRLGVGRRPTAKVFVWSAQHFDFCGKLEKIEEMFVFTLQLRTCIEPPLRGVGERKMVIENACLIGCCQRGCDAACVVVERAIADGKSVGGEP